MSQSFNASSTALQALTRHVGLVVEVVGDLDHFVQARDLFLGEVRLDIELAALQPVNRRQGGRRQQPNGSAALVPNSLRVPGYCPATSQ